MTLRPLNRVCVACAVAESVFLHRAFARTDGPVGFLRRAVWPLERSSGEPPDVCRRLFTALAWAAGAFAVIAVLSPEAASILHAVSLEPGPAGAALCVAVGVLGFMLVLRLARGLDAGNRTEAHMLLWATTLVYAGLVSGLACAFGVGAQSQAEFVPVAVVNVAGSAVAALVIAVAIATRLVRGVVFFSIVVGPFLVIAPELLWLGLVCALLLVVAVEATLHQALQMTRVPEPALAACFVAGLLALPVVFVHVTVRVLLRWLFAQSHRGHRDEQ